MNRRVSFPRHKGAGFTILELLVAVAIVAIVVVVAFQVIGMAWRMVTNDNKRIDAVTQARQALDRFGLDWNARVTRDDVAIALLNQPGNDSISFVTRMPAPTGDRSLAVVDYQINPTDDGGNTYKLERGALGFNWSGTDPTFSFPMTALPTLSTNDRQTLSPGVFRFKYALLTRETATNAPKLINGNATTLTNLAAVLVAVGVIDDKSRKLLSVDQMKRLADALPDPPDSNPDPLATWQTAINNPNFATNVGIPPVTVQGIKVYQRYFYVNP
jgi:prepilin-type N-terminal cleavage/methylation domain-containing protein